MNNLIIETNDATNVASLNKAAGVTFPALTSRTDFDAVAEPIYMANAETGRAQKIDAQIGRVIRRTDTAEALGIVGQRYGIAPNKPIFDMVWGGPRKHCPAMHWPELS